jgi:orotidine-5'-phosphate decarboxylase
MEAADVTPARRLWDTGADLFTRKTMRSDKPIPSEERLIVALDVPGIDDAKALVERLGDAVTFYKVGLELIIGGDYLRLVQWLRERGKKVMLDAKFFDIAETVGAAVRQAANHGVTFVTVHGNDDILRAAVAARGDMGILAVTVLTSLDRGDLDDLGFDVDVDKLVLSRAKRAVSLGCAGVVSSGQEAPALREQLGHGFVIVTPGIRPVENKVVDDDQKRITTVEQAFANGADYIVIGRPIRGQPDPRQAAEDVQRRIQSVFAG